MQSLKDYIDNIDESKANDENPLAKAKVGDKFFITLFKHEDEYAEVEISEINKRDENDFMYWSFFLKDNSLGVTRLSIANDYYGYYYKDGNFCHALVPKDKEDYCALIGKTKEELQNEIDGQYGDQLKELADKIEQKQKELNDLNGELAKLTSKIKLK